MNDDEPINPLLPFGIGIGVGVLSLWAIVELFPLLILGGAGYIVLKGLNANKETKEDTACNIGQQPK